ncbi:MAG: CoA-binding protein [Myxococcales bacterium]|nr:CoA-binding protein [Myxococcales bacterium]
MAHPLQAIMRDADGFVLIGESSKGRFPAYSYFAYTEVGKRFYCFDLDGLPTSRGKIKDGKVYSRVEDLPADRSDLAIIWVHPHSTARAVEVAHAAGCRRVWFSFQTGHATGVARAAELGLEVVEIGRCPVHYLDQMPAGCRAHTALVKVTGTWGRPPLTTIGEKRPRELW